MSLKRSKIPLLGLLFLYCAYFNTFYNAKTFYQKALDERKKNRSDKPTSIELRNYDKAIEKASKLLELYPNSRYVDDALMILGDCFLYKGEYLKAKRKFEELLSNFPESKLAPEAKFKLGQTLVKLEDFYSAEGIFKELLASKVDRKIKEESQLYLGEIFYIQNDHRKAIKEYEKALKARDKEVRAKAQFQIGQCYMSLKDYPHAAESFLKARKISSDRKFEADFHYALAQKAMGNYRSAVTVLERLLGEQKDPEEISKIRLEIASCLLEEGNVEQAFHEYESIIEDYPRSLAAAEACFRLGLICQNEMKDYLKAKEYFERVAKENSRSEFVPQARTRRSNIDKLLRLQKSIAEKFAQLSSDSLKTNKTIEELLRDKFLLAESYLFDFSLIDSALAQYTDILQKYPHSQYCPKALYALGYIYDKMKGDQIKADSLYQTLIKRYPNSIYAKKLSNSQAQTDSAKLLFLKAERELLKKGNPRKAVKIYKQLVRDFPGSDLVPKALYAIGWIYENDLKSPQEAIAAYRRLIEEFPNSIYAQKIKNKLALVDKQNDVSR